MHSTTAWRISVVGFAVAAALLVFVVWATFERLSALREATALVQHTLLVRGEAEAVASLLKDAETGQRGFIITGNTVYLEPYELALASLPESVERLRKLTADNPTQQTTIAGLEVLIQRKLAELRETVTERQQEGFGAAARHVGTDEGKRIMDAARRVVSAIDVEENRLLEERRSAQDRQARRATATSLAGLGAATALLVGATLLMSRAVGAREHERAARATAEAIAAAVRESEERLRVTIASIGDGVIATDGLGRVAQINVVAESLTGWTAAEAIGRPLEEIFVLINEQSREPAANPVHTVLRDGVIAGLANHTLLVSKDGREIPIDDSAAPIKTKTGQTVGVVLVFRDVVERRQAERERAALLQNEQTARAEAERIAEVRSRLSQDLRAARERVSQLIENVPGIVWEAWGEPNAAQQRIGFVSGYVEQMLGYSVDEWLQTPNFWLSIVHPDDRQRAAQAAAETFASGQSHANQFRWIAKDGHAVWVETRSSVISDESGQAVGMRGVTFDITERHEAEVALNRAKRDAEEANRVKDQFLAVASHELRTPLNAILGWAEMLHGGTLQETRRGRAVAAIYANAKRQAELVGELLDVSRIMSGKMRLDRTATDLPEVIRAAIEVVQSSADAKRIHIGVDVDPSIGPFYADSARLQQVLWNLLSNAIKFTPDNGAIHVRLCRVDAGMELVVTDTGEGIPAAVFPSIFEPFQQADGATTRRHGGLGLGLSIVRHLVEAHGGTVSAECGRKDQGATFIVRLPIVAVYKEEPEQGATSSSPLSEAAPDPSAATTSLCGLSVLVVDDDEESRELLLATLESHGAVAVAAASAAAALDVIDNTRVDVLLSDIAMPGQDGYSLIRGIRARETSSTTFLPAAALTSFARDEDRQKAIEAGFQLHLTKPIDSRSLVEAVASLANRAQPL
jgi:PAS domain S-box-containing protein